MSAIKKEKPKHLGKGLESLLGPITAPVGSDGSLLPQNEFAPDNELRKSFRQLSLKSLRPNPYQPRTSWDEQQLQDLAASIKANGVIQPIIVRQAGDAYELIAGERRFRAAQMAGLETIPALVREASDDQLLELALVENIHRTDLNAIERAKAYKKYVSTFSLTQSDAADRLGEDRSVIANHMRLLDLPQQIQQMLVEGKLSMGHARSLLSLPTDELRRKLAHRAFAGRLSVREVERLVRNYLDNSNRPGKVAAEKLPHIIDLEDKLTNLFSTKVSIETRKSGQKGKISIEFYSLDDFDRITQKIGLSDLEPV